MFPDPQMLTYNGVTSPLPKINQDRYSSEYLSRWSTGESRLAIRNTTYVDKRKVAIDRHNVEFIHVNFPTPPSTLAVRRKVYLVIENEQGDALAEISHLVKMAADWMLASSGANITKLLNFES